MKAASAHIRNSMRTDDWWSGTPHAKPVSGRSSHLIFDYAVAEEDIHAHLHGLEFHREGARKGRHSYCPIRFVPREKLTSFDKLLLASDWLLDPEANVLALLETIDNSRLCALIYVS